jgi:hypothetical protein
MFESVTWPQGKRFAFTIFDDPDAQSLAVSQTVYSFLRDLGFKTTIGAWTIEPAIRNSPGETCELRAYRQWLLELQSAGFEIGFHNGAPGSLERPEIIRALDLFRSHFGHDPVAMANHYNQDAIYWGNARLSGLVRAFYDLTSVGRGQRFFGHVEGHPSFWGDLCRQRIRYCRNFVFREINTLRACQYMPYFDPARPYVASWYASTEGANCPVFLKQLAEKEQDRLEAEAGACVMYTHFGHGFVDEKGRLHPEFKRLMSRLAAKNAWFVPTGALLDYLRAQRGGQVYTIQAAERRGLERAWLAGKLFHGTS